MQRTVYPEHKTKYFKQMNDLLDQYDKMLLVGCDNVQSKQMNEIRAALRGKATLLMGKNTMMHKILKTRTESGEERDKMMYHKLVLDKLLQGNVGIVFTDQDLNDVKKVLEANRVQAPARQGALSPVDVIIPAGNTGLEPTKTSFFQALNIGTKITKGTVEILKDTPILTEGVKVGSSEATLLQMLNIKPFFYGLVIQHVYDHGSVYGVEILSLTDEDKMKKVQAGINNITAFSLGCGYTTKASFPHVMMNGFKNLLALSLETDYTFEEFNGAELKEAILSGKAVGGGGGGGGGDGGGAEAAAEAPAAAAEEEAEDSEDDDMGMGLFD